MSLTIQELDQEQFSSIRETWTELLDRSTADKLFLSWEWQYSWWNIFSDPASMTLKLLAAYNNKGVLLGVAPLYISAEKTKKIIPTRRLQLIGNCWRGKVTMKTELLEFIVDRISSNEVVQAFLKHISSMQGWNEFVCQDLRKESDTYRNLQSKNLINNSYTRITDEQKSYFLNLDRDFDDYVKQLGRNTRLRLYNRRKVLEQTGEVCFSRMDNEDITSKFELLNEFHLKRWGSPAFGGSRLQFNRVVAEYMKQRNALNFSVLSVNKSPISIQYNYIVDGHEYNIQAGFDEMFHKKIALGYLHFGYEIEYGCSSNLKVYDFLVGRGKNSQYKERLTNSSEEVVVAQVIRGFLLKIVYRIHDFIQRI